MHLEDRFVAKNLLPTNISYKVWHIDEMTPAFEPVTRALLCLPWRFEYLKFLGGQQRILLCCRPCSWSAFRLDLSHSLVARLTCVT